MDVFIEELVKKRKEGKDYAILAILILVGLVLSVCLLLGVLFGAMIFGQWGQIAGSVGMVLVAAVWYAVYLINNSRSIEYEYIGINNNIDKNKVMEKKRRTNVIELDIKDA